MNGGHDESLGIRNRKKLIGDLFKNSSSKGAIWEKDGVNDKNNDDRMVMINHVAFLKKKKKKHIFKRIFSSA